MKKKVIIIGALGMDFGRRISKYIMETIQDPNLEQKWKGYQ